jgi:hypothetical protein
VTDVTLPFLRIINVNIFCVEHNDKNIVNINYYSNILLVQLT